MTRVCRNVLVHQIETALHKGAAAVTNFKPTLPSPQSNIAQQITRDPYTFDFLMLTEDAHERELEQGLLRHLRDCLLESGCLSERSRAKIELAWISATRTLRSDSVGVYSR